MKFFLILLFALFLFSCKKKEEKLREKFIPLLTTMFTKEKFWVTKVDSIKIYRIDEISDMKYSLNGIDNLKSEKSFYGVLKESLDDALIGEKKKGSVSYFKDTSFTVSDINKYKDTIQHIVKKMDSISEKIKTGKVSSENFRGYIVLLKLSGSFDTTKVKMDSMRYFISPNLKAIPDYKIESINNGN